VFVNLRRRVCVAACAVSTLIYCCVCLPSGSTLAHEDETRALFFSGRDIWRNGAFAYGGFLFAPNSLDRDGVLLKFLLSSGLYVYDAENLGGQRILGVEALVNILPGWRIKRGDAELKFFMGPEFQKHRLWPDDQTNRLRGNAYGLRLAAEIWYEPTSDTMIAADGFLSTIATSNSARVAYGWRVFEEMLGGIYIGPEIQYFGSDGYKHLRLGTHITSMKAEDTEWSAALGWAMDSSHRSSPYLRLSIVSRR
jgi:hypothetical protein